MALKLLLVWQSKPRLAGYSACECTKLFIRRRLKLIGVGGVIGI